MRFISNRFLIFFLTILLFISSFVSCNTVDPINKNSDDEVINYFRERLSETSLFEGETVYWTKNGTVYHLYPDCKFLSESENVKHGAASQSGRSEVCSACLKKLEQSTASETEITDSISSEESLIDQTSEETISAFETETAPHETTSTGQEIIDSTVFTESESTSYVLTTVQSEDNSVSEYIVDTEQPVQNNRTVYWTPNGSVWHYDRNCSALSRSQEILSGTIEESGKERGCKLCS